MQATRWREWLNEQAAFRDRSPAFRALTIFLLLASLLALLLIPAARLLE